MDLSSDLISRFVKATKDETKTKTESTSYGKIVERDGRKYVQLDGSELLTPIDTTTNVENDERVTVTIKDHKAIVTGNLSSPSARTEEVEKVSNKITEFEIVITDKVSVKQLEAETARINTLVADNVTIREKLTANEGYISELRSDNVTINEKLTANEADIKKLSAEKIDAKIVEADYATIKSLEATDATVNNLKATYGEFVELTTDNFEAVNADIKKLNTEKLTAKEADIKYANIDFSNIGQAAMEYFYAQSGLIENVKVGDATIAGELVGVTIKGDLIEGNTIKADKLVVKGEDGLYYKLNFEAGEFKSAEEVPTDTLHGSVITANSITAEKITVKDLVAFGATIGGFNIRDHSIYSGVKESIDNTTRGIYLGDDGQIAIGDGNNYLKYFKDEDGYYKLEIAAESIEFHIGDKSISEVVKEANEAVDKIGKFEEQLESGGLKGEDATLLRIDSSRGTVFKNNAVSTVLSAVIYKGSKRITDITELKKEYGASAYLEWQWQRIGESSFGTILANDIRIGNDGFTFTLSPDDVDTKVVFMCNLITD